MAGYLLLVALAFALTIEYGRETVIAYRMDAWSDAIREEWENVGYKVDCFGVICDSSYCNIHLPDDDPTAKPDPSICFTYLR